MDVVHTKVHRLTQEVVWLPSGEASDSVVGLLRQGGFSFCLFGSAVTVNDGLGECYVIRFVNRGRKIPLTSLEVEVSPRKIRLMIGCSISGGGRVVWCMSRGEEGLCPEGFNLR